MIESALTFGMSAQIIGVLTEPNESCSNSEYPTILLLNAGLLGRVGPFRAHVILARELALLGFRSLRIDMSGIGDSGRHRDNRTREEQHLGDIRDALNYMENERGATTFVVIGICTGADYAHRAMVQDDRIIGAVCIDGYAYPTAKYFAKHYFSSFLSLRSWGGILTRLIDGSRRSGSLDYALEQHDQLNYRWVLPPKKKTESDFREFLRRDANLLCIYTASWPYNYTGQLADSFRSINFEDLISVAYLSDVTHTFKVHEDRKKLISTITSWLNSKWNAEHPGLHQ